MKSEAEPASSKGAADRFHLTGLAFSHLRVVCNGLVLQSTEVGDAEDGESVGVELLLGGLVIVTLACEGEAKQRGVEMGVSTSALLWMMGLPSRCVCPAQGT